MVSPPARGSSPTGRCTCDRTAWRRRRRWTHCVAAGQLGGGDHALLEQQRLDRVEPAFVVGGAQVFVRRHALDRVTELVEVVVTAVRARHHRPHDALPALMKHGLVALDVDGTEAVHAAHVVHAVHLLRIMEILPLWPRMWRRVSIAATLILVSACLQSGGPQSFDVCGPAPTVGASLCGA